MITAVIDTNVFVSALIGGGTPLAAIESTRLGKSHLLVTTEIVTEMQQTLERPKFARHFQRRETEPRLFISNYTTVITRRWRGMSPLVLSQTVPSRTKKT